MISRGVRFSPPHFSSRLASDKKLIAFLELEARISGAVGQAEIVSASTPGSFVIRQSKTFRRDRERQAGVIFACQSAA